MKLLLLHCLLTWSTYTYYYAKYLIGLPSGWPQTVTCMLLVGAKMILETPVAATRNSGGSPGLVVFGDDSCSRGCGYKSYHHILTFFHFDLLFKLYCLFEKTENKLIRGRGLPIFNKQPLGKMKRNVNI